MPNESTDQTSVPNERKLGQPNLRRLRERAELLRALRRFFDDRDFLEVQPPCLSQGCIVDAYIDPLTLSSDQLRLGIDLAPQYYLQTSPELAMKRILAAGGPSIYSLGPVFRSGERGEYHNTEFTMLEWYEVGASVNEGIELLGRLSIEMLDCDSFDVVSYRELFHDAFNLDPIDSPLDDVRDAMSTVDSGLVASIGNDRDSMLDVLLSQSIQPNLGVERPVIIKNYPLSQGALAKQSNDDPQCASRFELFAAGVELANGYDELRDAHELSERFRNSNERRIAAGRAPIAGCGSSLEQMISGALPQCAGVAMGVDRLLMVRTGEQRIENVVPFTIDLA